MAINHLLFEVFLKAKMTLLQVRNRKKNLQISLSNERMYKS